VVKTFGQKAASQGGQILTVAACNVIPTIGTMMPLLICFAEYNAAVTDSAFQWA